MAVSVNVADFLKPKAALKKSSTSSSEESSEEGEFGIYVVLSGTMKICLALTFLDVTSQK